MKKIVTKKKFDKYLVILLLKIESKYKVNLIFKPARNIAAKLQNGCNLIVVLHNHSATFQQRFSNVACATKKILAILQCCNVNCFFKLVKMALIRLTRYSLFTFFKCSSMYRSSTPLGNHISVKVHSVLFSTNSKGY